MEEGGRKTLSERGTHTEKEPEKVCQPPTFTYILLSMEYILSHDVTHTHTMVLKKKKKETEKEEKERERLPQALVLQPLRGNSKTFLPR